MRVKKEHNIESSRQYTMVLWLRKRYVKYLYIIFMWKFVMRRENDTTCICSHDDKTCNENGKYYKLSNLIYNVCALI